MEGGQGLLFRLSVDNPLRIVVATTAAIALFAAASPGATPSWPGGGELSTTRRTAAADSRLTRPSPPLTQAAEPEQNLVQLRIGGLSTLLESFRLERPRVGADVHRADLAAGASRAQQINTDQRDFAADLAAAHAGLIGHGLTAPPPPGL